MGCRWVDRRGREGLLRGDGLRLGVRGASGGRMSILGSVVKGGALVSCWQMVFNL